MRYVWQDIMCEMYIMLTCVIQLLTQGAGAGQTGARPAL